MRFKAELEFSIDADGSCWVYFPNAAVNLSHATKETDIVNRNVLRWFQVQKSRNLVPLLEKIVNDENLPQTVRDASRASLNKE